MRRALRAAAWLAGMLLAFAQLGRAQPARSALANVLAGSVRAGDESRLVGARVELRVGGTAGAPVLAVTGVDGLFRFEQVPAGVVQLIVRRLGFRPESLSVELPQVDGGPVVVMLERVAQTLAPVLVSERRLSPLSSDFERRRSAGFGHYITRADIERQNPMRTTDLLRMIPGVTFSGPDGSRAPRFRATSAGGCGPAFFVDGMPIGGALDLDAISPRSIESMEVYSGAATLPTALRSRIAPGGCGAIVIWSRQGGRSDDGVGDPGSSTDELDRYVERGLAYTADQVELTAAPLPGFAPAPVYPDSLRSAGVRGRVTAEFIIDTRGRVEPETVGIVSSTHPILARAVRDAIVGARFSPAYRKGQVVRQVVQLPVVFDPVPPSSPRQ